MIKELLPGQWGGVDCGAVNTNGGRFLLQPRLRQVAAENHDGRKDEFYDLHSNEITRVTVGGADIDDDGLLAAEGD